jgi:lantibiotic modifying enzyme
MDGKRALDLALALGDDLGRPGQEADVGPDLAGGRAGIALFLSTLWQAAGRDADADAAVSHLGAAVEASVSGGAPSELPAGLFEGQAGVAWVVDRLAADLVDLDTDPNEGLDRALVRLIADAPGHDPYDLISGLAGFGVYAAARLPRPEAASALTLIVRRLAETARARDGGLTWWTPPALLPEWQRKTYPDGYYDVGVAHGVAGVIAVLARCDRAGVAAGEARRLLDGAVTWLLAQRLPPGGPTTFPSVTFPGVGPWPARSAWCYGDPGIAATLLAAARAVRRPWWEAEAVAIGVRAAARPAADSGVSDAGLCHGAAGLAHIFTRLWAASDDPRLADAARFWLDRTVQLLPELDAPGFLEGRAGGGLALLAAATDIEPVWDDVLLLS